MPRRLLLDLSALTWPEAIRMAGGLTKFPLYLIARATGALGRFSITQTECTPFEHFEVEIGELPEEARAAFEPVRREAESLGFVEPLVQVAQGTELVPVQNTLTMRHPTKGCVLRSLYCRHAEAPVGAGTLTRSLLARTVAGAFVSVDDSRPMFDPPPQILDYWVRASRVQDLVSLLESRQYGPGEALKQVPDGESAKRLVDACEIHSIDYGISLGKWKLIEESQDMTPARGTVDEELSATPTAAEGVVERDPVLDAIAKQGESKHSWSKALWMGVLSLALFVGLGGLAWDWTFVILLALAVLVHELGHLVAMKMLGYRDVRILFLPLLGAATIGRQSCVPGWKKAVVALAGPVPSIAAAIAAILLLPPGMFDAQYQFLSLVLLLNGLNLLPLLPFDGGWSANALIFNRHHVLEVLFRIFTVCMLSLGAWSLSSWFLGGFAFFMAMSIPQVRRQGRLAAELRQAGFAAERDVTGAMGEATHLALARAVRERVGVTLPPETVGLMVTNLIERLESPAPGPFVTLLLLSVHVGALFASVIGLIAQRGF